MAERDVRVVVTGMGAVSCLGRGVAAMWRALLDGRCGIGPLTKLDAAKHRIKHAGEVRPGPGQVEGDVTDPAIRFVLEAAEEAVNQAALSAAERKTAALVLGSNFGAMASVENLLSGAADAGVLRAFMHGPTESVAGALGLQGIRSTLSLSCASGNAAIAYAADLIRSGRAHVVLAGAYDAISELVWAGLCSLRAMSATAIRPFDKRRDGTIFSEGAGVLVLENYAHARARGQEPAAEVLGHATSSNAFHLTHPDPEGAGTARAMRDALRDAGIEPNQVDHINAHATGTKFNDVVETAAVKSVFGDHARAMPINGIKSMLGHAMGAAGALEAIATVMTIREGVVPPTIGLDEPDPECDLDYVPLKARKADIRIALNNSAGFGGCNASVIFGETSL